MQVNGNSGFNTMQRGLSSYMEDRLNGKAVTAEGETQKVIDGQAVQISISPEARQALDAIDRATEAYATVARVLGATSLDATAQTRLGEIGAELDKLYGNNVKPTSESYLMLGDDRLKANDLITDINTLMNKDPRTDAENVMLAEKIESFDKMLAHGTANASHAVGDLSPEKQKEVMAMFADLAEKSQGLETNSLTTSQLNASADLSTLIDKLFEADGKLLPAKELSADDKTKADVLLAEIDNIMTKAGSESISNKLRMVQEQTYASFLDMLTGRTSAQPANDPLAEFMNNRYGSSSAVSANGNINLAQLNAYTQNGIV
jgi:hypothetical protein